MTTESVSGSVGIWAWFLPAAYGVHVVEETFGGRGFMEWMVAVGGVRLSIAAFIGLNIVGVAALCLAAWAARRSKRWRGLLVSGAAIVFVNGFWHSVMSASVRSYIPGVLTGFFLYIPLGGVFLFRLRRLVSLRTYLAAIAVGITIHEAALWIVLRTSYFHR